MSETLMATYNRIPLRFQIGQGAWLWDQEGRRYLDGVSGVAVCNLGHAHPVLSAALGEQAATLLHTSNLYQIPLQQQLADRLCALSGLEKAFFCNSGAEAVEAAIKIARCYGHQKKVDEPHILVMEKSFHGRTLGALSATGNLKIQEGFAPLVPGFVRVAFNDLDAVAKAAKQYPNIVAVLVEPVQGEGGVHVPDDQYLNGLRQICDQHDWLLMLDEIQTGMGRTGQWFAFQHTAIVPDVMCLAKGLGNGVPIGACLARGKAANCFQPGSHGSTFGGNLLACRAGLTVIELIEKHHLLHRVQATSDFLFSTFRAALGDHPRVREIRGKGLLIGIELDCPCADLVGHALDKQLLINVTSGNVIRLLPPFIVDESQQQYLAETVITLVREFLQPLPEVAA